MRILQTFFPSDETDKCEIDQWTSAVKVRLHGQAIHVPRRSLGNLRLVTRKKPKIRRAAVWNKAVKQCNNAQGLTYSDFFSSLVWRARACGHGQIMDCTIFRKCQNYAGAGIRPVISKIRG